MRWRWIRNWIHETNFLNFGVKKEDQSFLEKLSFKITAQECKKSTSRWRASLKKTLIQNFFSRCWTVLISPSSLTFLNLKDICRKGSPFWEAETDIFKAHPTIRSRHNSAMWKEAFRFFDQSVWLRWAQINIAFQKHCWGYSEVHHVLKLLWVFVQTYCRSDARRWRIHTRIH